MHITSARYYTVPNKTENEGVEAVIDGLTVHVPLDPSNRHYAEIMRQVDEGSLTIAEAE